MNHAENSLIGCILKDSSIIREITLTSEHFSDLSIKQLYSIMEELNQEGIPIDPVTLVERMGPSLFNRLGGIGYLSELMDSVPSVHSFKTYESLILKDWKARTTRSLLKEFINRDLKEESINEIIFELNNVAQAGVKETFNKKEELLKQYEALDREPEKVGMKSGFTDLDLMTDGFQHGDSIIIGARPSMGKTALILNIALNVARNGVIPIIFSLEMGRESLIKRMLSALGRVDGSFAHNPYKYIKGEDRIRWTDAIGVLEKVDFHIFDKSEQTINEMRSKVRQIQRDYLNQRIVVMIDYLTLIKPINTFNGNAHQQVTEISKQLKVMAKDFGIPVLTLAQLSRSVEQRHNKRPMMSDLRESGSIEQDADLIMLLYRDHYYNEESPEKNLLEINITKQRNGAIGTILLQYEKEYNLVRNLSRR